jgi:integrase
MSKRNRKPVKVGPLRAYVTRTREDGSLYWQVSFYEGNERRTVKGASGWYTHKQVERLLAELFASDDYREAPKELTVETISDLLDTWTSAKRAQVGTTLAESSADSYEATARQIRRELGAAKLSRLRPSDLERFRDALLRRLAPSTVGQCLRVLRLSWAWGRQRGLTPDTELPRISLPQRDRHVYNHVTPTEQDVQAVLTKLAGWRHMGVFLLWYTGARVGEISQLRWEDLDLDREEITLRRKAARRGGTREVTLPLHPTLAGELRAWGPGDADQPVLGVTPLTARRALRDALETACKAAEVPRFTPHGLRRLAGTRLMERGVSPKVYERVMGHSFTMGLRVYAQARSTEVEAAVAILGPVVPEDGSNVYEGPWEREA